MGDLPERERGGVTGPFVADQLERDGEFREEVAAAVELGIPYSIFTGRIVAPGEPVWLDSDRAIVIAYLRWKRHACCPDCGTPKAEAWSTYPGTSWDHWEPTSPRCYACGTAERAASTFAKGPDGGKPGDPSGMKFLTRRR